jgi:hypothetical protein
MRAYTSIRNGSRDPGSSMTRSRPPIVATRAVNQYRRRDILPYLCLRYCLENQATRSNEWLRRVAIRLAKQRAPLRYYCLKHFKELRGGKTDLRDIFVPGAVEAVAEAVLLSRCSVASHVFGTPRDVFSYRLAEGDDRQGIFQHYSSGLRARHAAVARACRAEPGQIVAYRDIKAYYPSISLAKARTTWERYAAEAGLDADDVSLGVALIEGHRGCNPSAPDNLLVGPMLSHLIGNLVLRDLDTEFAGHPSVRYFRYVDDIILVGEHSRVVEASSRLSSRLAAIHLQMHPAGSSKNFDVSAEEWLKGEYDYADSNERPSWKTLIGELKTFLIHNPSQREALAVALRNEGIRIPVVDYSSAIAEQTYLTQLAEWAKCRWYRAIGKAASIVGIVQQARELAERFEEGLAETADHFKSASLFGRKRFAPKLRYRLNRLAYLAPPDRLPGIKSAVDGIPEVACHAAVIDSLYADTIDSILGYGCNASNVVAQVIRANGAPVRCGLSNLSDTMTQSLSMFPLNGVNVQTNAALSPRANDLWEFATVGYSEAAARGSCPVLREATCLHGSGPLRHAGILNTAFDVEEIASWDAIDGDMTSGAS